MIASWYDRPKFNSIEIVRGTQVWQLSKKDDVGNFVTVRNRPSETASTQIVVYGNDAAPLLDLSNDEDFSVAKNISF